MTAPRKSAPLLGYLLLHRNAAVSRSFLSFLLWPDESEDSARAKLRATLYDLQRILPPAPDGHWMRIDGTTIHWNPEADLSLDVDDFERVIDERPAEAVQLYSGDLLESLYDDWILAPRERLRSAYRSALGRLLSQARQRGDFPNAIASARRLLETDPLREDVARRLIALRYEAGDRAGALEEYARFEKRVRNELGIELMPETVAVREAIVRNAAIGSTDVKLLEAPKLAAKAAMPFVGRSDEMQRLLSGWSRSVRGAGGLVFIGGDPGIGKSRLVSELAHEVDERGGRVLLGATGSPEAMPYQAIVEALRSTLPLVASLRLDDIWFGVLATLLPELANKVESVDTLARLEPESEQNRLFGALARTFVALTEPRPVLLVLEDLHWAGEATVAALTFLARRLALVPVFVVVTYRDDETPRHHPLRRARHELVTAGLGQSLSLRPLSVSDLEHLTENLVQPPKGSAAALHAASGGNPLLLSQLLDEPAEEDDREHPSTLESVIAARIERLSPEARSLAEIAALIGQRFSREVVRDVAAWDETPFSNALDELLDRRIVREATGRGAFDFAFAHQAVRDVVEAGVPEHRLLDRHRRIARALRELYPSRGSEFAAAIARHCELARDAESAARHHLIAARHALSLAALSEAAEHVERGLALTSEPALRFDLLEESDRICSRTGNRAARAAALQELTSLADTMGDTERRCRAALLRVRFGDVVDDATLHIAALNDLRALAPEAGEHWRVTLILEESRFAERHGELGPHEAAARAALKLAKKDADHASIARAHVLIADAHIHRGQLAEASSHLEQAQAASARALDGATEFDSLRANFLLYYQLADVERCVAIAERFLERGIALGDRNMEAGGYLRVGTALLAARRDVDRAREAFSRASAIYEELAYERGIANVHHSRGILENEIGDFVAATTSTEKALKTFEKLRDNRGRATALANLAQLRAASGEASKALSEGRVALEIARASAYHIQEACALENLAMATAACGDLSEAIRLGTEALSLHRNTESAHWCGRVLSDLGYWHAAAGDLRRAREIVEEMLSQQVRVAFEWPQRFYWIAAQVLHACGEDALAERQLARARELYDALAHELVGEDLERYESIPWNREIVAAVDRDEWPSLPRD